MKKTIIIGLALILSAAVLNAVVYEYLEKSIEQRTGVSPTCWRIDRIEIKMGIQKPFAIVRFVGYKDIDAFVAGKEPCGRQDAFVENVHELQSYPAMFQEILLRIIQSDAFYGAEYKTKEVEE